MKTHKSLVTALACAAGLMAAAAPLQAVVLVSDTFTHANGAFILSTPPTYDTGYAPGTNVLGGNYIKTGGGSGDGSFISNTAQFRNGGGVGLAMGSYNDNAILTLTVDFSFNNVTAPIQTTGFGLMGFWTATSTGSYTPGSAATNFTGLRVNLDGSINLLLQGTVTGSAVAYGGTFNGAVAQSLTYTVDTTTGAISGISFGASTANYSTITTSGFTAARTEFVGMGGSLGNSPNYAVFDNFNVTNAVPEPSTYALMLGGLALLFVIRRARKTAV